MELEEIELQRSDNVPLQFMGTYLGGANSFSHGKSRWLKIEIFKTESGKYVVSRVGVSDNRDEEDLHKVEVCNTAEEVVDFLRRPELECTRCGSSAYKRCRRCGGTDIKPNGNTYLTNTAQEALEVAAYADTSDPGISDALVEKL